MNEKHVKENFDEKLQLHGKIKTIGTDQIIVSEETHVNFIS